MSVELVRSYVRGKVVRRKARWQDWRIVPGLLLDSVLRAGVVRVGGRGGGTVSVAGLVSVGIILWLD